MKARFFAFKIVREDRGLRRHCRALLCMRKEMLRPEIWEQLTQRLRCVKLAPCFGPAEYLFSARSLLSGWERASPVRLPHEGFFVGWGSAEGVIET